MQLSKKEIESLLPHREPMLLLDSVELLRPEQAIEASFTVEPGRPELVGHFPGNPLFPGVLQLECMAQACDLVLLSRLGMAGKLPLLTAVQGARFLRPVQPGDSLKVEATLEAQVGDSADFAGTLTVACKMVATAKLTITLK